MTYIILLICFAIGVPIVFSLGLSCVLAILTDPSMSMIWITQKMFAGVNSFPYLALPFFILAGNIMAKGGISRRLVKFCSTLVGRFQGGLAIVAVLVSLFFGAISGSAIACCAAVGAILIPGMLEKGYPRDFSAATISIASCLGVMIPPSVPMVLYCFMAGSGVSISDGFLAGVVPGFLFALVLIVVAVVISHKRGYGGDRKYSGQEKWCAFKDALLALLTPVIILGGIYSGLLTATESAAVACVWAFIAGVFIYKEIKIADLIPILMKSAKSAAMILFIIAASTAFSWVFTFSGASAALVQLVVSMNLNKTLFCLVVAIILLMIMNRDNKPSTFLNDSERMLSTVGPLSMLPMLLACLGSVFTAAGVGDVISDLVSHIIPEGNVNAGIVVYAIGMMLFTMIMGNAYAAITVMTVGIGYPFVLAHGANPVVIGMLALTCGFCGTLCTPMAANFNTVPVALLDMKKPMGVIKNQVPVAIIMMVVQIVMMILLK